MKQPIKGYNDIIDDLSHIPTSDNYLREDLQDEDHNKIDENIEDVDPHSWGQYQKPYGWISKFVWTGKAVRQWIQNKIATLQLEKLDKTDYNTSIEFTETVVPAGKVLREQSKYVKILDGLNQESGFNARVLIPVQGFEIIFYITANTPSWKTLSNLGAGEHVNLELYTPPSLSGQQFIGWTNGGDNVIDNDYIIPTNVEADYIIPLHLYAKWQAYSPTLTMYSFAMEQTSNFTSSTTITNLEYNTPQTVRNRYRYHYIPSSQAIHVYRDTFSGSDSSSVEEIGAYDADNQVYKINNVNLEKELIIYKNI